MLRNLEVILDIIMDESQPSVSVIIPVFNDTERLKTCLNALENQTYPKNLYEVIVVDNNSDESIEEAVSHYSQALVTYESSPGSYAARNKGISLARGEVIAFTDSDCIPSSDWLDKGVANMLRVSNCGFVAGKIKLFFKNPDKPTAAELYDSIVMNFRQDENIEERKFGATANLFTSKRVIYNIGLFDATLKSNGDREWGNRVFLSGYEQIYADDTCVAHPARYFLDDTYKRAIRIIGGRYTLKKKNGYSNKEFIKDILLGLLPPFRVNFRIWSDKRLNGSQQKIQVILVVFLIKYVEVFEKIRLHIGGSPKRV